VATGVLRHRQTPSRLVPQLWVSKLRATLAPTNATGFQTGSFVAAPYVDASPPALFLPQLTNSQFQSYLSGQPGFVYSIETSADLARWQPCLPSELPGCRDYSCGPLGSLTGDMGKTTPGFLPR
jgi:hypothetical protein